MSERTYEKVVPVEIVRPGVSPRASFVLRWGEFFLSTWVVMLALGALLPFPQAHLGYWMTALGMVAIRNLRPSKYLEWTRARRAVKA